MTEHRYAITDHHRYVTVSFTPATRINKDLAKEILAREIELLRGTGKNDLWDVRGCLIDPDVNFESLRELVMFLRDNEARKVTSGKTALLVDTAIAFGIVRTFQSIAEVKNLGYEIEVFEDEGRAIAWLNRTGNTGDADNDRYEGGI